MAFFIKKSNTVKKYFLFEDATKNDGTTIRIIVPTTSTNNWKQATIINNSTSFF
jgi:hypothetical protein